MKWVSAGREGCAVDPVGCKPQVVRPARPLEDMSKLRSAARAAASPYIPAVLAQGPLQGASQDMWVKLN